MEINLSELGIDNISTEETIENRGETTNSIPANDNSKTTDNNNSFTIVDMLDSDKPTNDKPDNKSERGDNQGDRKNNSKLVKSISNKSPVLINALVTKWSNVPLDEDEREMVSYATELLLNKYSAIIENTPEGFAIVVIAIIIMNRTIFKKKVSQLELAV